MEIEQPNDVGLLVKLGGFIGSHIMIEEKKKELSYNLSSRDFNDYESYQLDT